MKTISAFFAICLLATRLFALTPEQAALVYLDAVKAGGLDAIAPLMHPGELEKFRAMLTPVVEAALLDAEQSEVFAVYADETDPGKIKPMSDVEFMRVFLQWLTTLNPMIGDILKAASGEVLGHVTEGKISHVVVRMKTNSLGAEIEQMTVISFKDHDGRPMLMLSGEIKNMAALLLRQS